MKGHFRFLHWIYVNILKGLQQNFFAGPFHVKSMRWLYIHTFCKKIWKDFFLEDIESFFLDTGQSTKHGPEILVFTEHQNCHYSKEISNERKFLDRMHVMNYIAREPQTFFTEDDAICRPKLINIPVFYGQSGSLELYKTCGLPKKNIFRSSALEFSQYFFSVLFANSGFINIWNNCGFMGQNHYGKSVRWGNFHRLQRRRLNVDYLEYFRIHLTKPKHDKPWSIGLVFRNVTKEVEGLYVCVADIEGYETEAQKEFELSIYSMCFSLCFSWKKGIHGFCDLAGINFDAVETRQAADIGKDYTLKCAVTGTPQPVIDWRRNEVAFDSNGEPSRWL